MRVSEKLHFDDYYRDPRFQKKKPLRDGGQNEGVGDNMYFRDVDGQWRQHPTDYHDDPQSRAQDRQEPYVFIAEKFYYFGAHHRLIVACLRQPTEWNSTGGDEHADKG